MANDCKNPRFVSIKTENFMNHMNRDIKLHGSIEELNEHMSGVGSADVRAYELKELKLVPIEATSVRIIGQKVK